jgi:hypothetical protein
MSIFAVIKYPISDPPTEEQIIALPVDLLQKWLCHPSVPICKDSEDLILLRRLILEYDE